MTNAVAMSSSSTAADWDVSKLLEPRRPRLRSRTTLDFGTLPPAIARAIGAWGVADLLSTPAQEIPMPTTAVEAVDYIVRVLQVRRDRVFTAAGVAERTFYGWQNDGRSPREANVRALWSWVEILSQLQASRPSVVGWFHSDAVAQAAFDAGDVEAFLTAEMHSALHDRSPKPKIAADLYADETPALLPPHRAFNAQPARRASLIRRREPR